MGVLDEMGVFDEEGDKERAGKDSSPFPWSIVLIGHPPQSSGGRVKVEELVI